MRNKILQLTRRIIPYVRELNPITGSINASLTMQQLDFYFEQYPNGFYKFLKPCAHTNYRSGDSWTEELGMTEEEFVTAFKRIGIRYKTKSLWTAARNKFAVTDDNEVKENRRGNPKQKVKTKNKLYASYHDRQTGLTHYFRNHDLVDRLLDEIISPNGKAESVQKNDRCKPGIPVHRKPDLPVYGEQEITVPANPETRFPETVKPGFYSNTHAEITKNNNKDHTHNADDYASSEEGRVCEESTYTVKQIVEYVQHCRQTGQNIRNVQGLAIKLQRTGEADELIDDYFAALTKGDLTATETNTEADSDVMKEYEEHRAALIREESND